MFEIGKKIKEIVFVYGDLMSTDEKLRFQHYSIFSIVGIPVMMLFGWLHLMKGNYLLFSFILLVAMGLSVGWFLLRRIIHGKIVCRINTMLFGLLLVYALVAGGEGGSKSLWLFVFPLVSFFLLGIKEGIIWSSALLLIVGILFINPFGSFTVYPYSNGFKMRFVIIYFSVGVFANCFEYFRHYYRQALENKNKLLQQEIFERKLVQKERENLIAQLHKALTDVKTLSGFLPICSSCKKIRDDDGYWNQIEKYIQEHSDAEFSHGLCPDCVTELYSDFLGEEFCEKMSDKSDHK